LNSLWPCRSRIMPPHNRPGGRAATMAEKRDLFVYQSNRAYL
jgi:hypothetical protein